MASFKYMARLKRDIQDLISHDFSCSSSSLTVTQQEGEGFVLNVCIHEGPYHGGHFVFFLEIPEMYPFASVKVRAVRRPCWHPNIELKTGRVVMPMEWSPVITLTVVALAVQMMLLEPSADNPMNVEACSLFAASSAAPAASPASFAFEAHVQRTLQGCLLGCVEFPAMSTVDCIFCKSPLEGLGEMEEEGGESARGWPSSSSSSSSCSSSSSSSSSSRRLGLGVDLSLIAAPSRSRTRAFSQAAKTAYPPAALCASSQFRLMADSRRLVGPMLSGGGGAAAAAAGGGGGGRRWGSSFSPSGSSGPRVAGGKRRSRGYCDGDGEGEEEEAERETGLAFGFGLTGPTIACSSGDECGFCSSSGGRGVGDACAVLRLHPPASSISSSNSNGERYMRCPPLLSSRRGGGKRLCIMPNLPGLGLGAGADCSDQDQDQDQDLCDVEDASSQKFDELYIERGGAGAW